jgi:hypothetical protein
MDNPGIAGESLVFIFRGIPQTHVGTEDSHRSALSAKRNITGFWLAIAISFRRLTHVITTGETSGFWYGRGNHSLVCNRDFGSLLAVMADALLRCFDLDRLWIVIRKEANLNEAVRNRLCAPFEIFLIVESDAKDSIAQNNATMILRFSR